MPPRNGALPAARGGKDCRCSYSTLAPSGDALPLWNARAASLSTPAEEGTSSVCGLMRVTGHPSDRADFLRRRPLGGYGAFDRLVASLRRRETFSASPHAASGQCGVTQGSRRT